MSLGCSRRVEVVLGIGRHVDGQGGCLFVVLCAVYCFVQVVYLRIMESLALDVSENDRIYPTLPFRFAFGATTLDVPPGIRRLGKGFLTPFCSRSALLLLQLDLLGRPWYERLSYYVVVILQSSGIFT